MTRPVVVAEGLVIGWAGRGLLPPVDLVVEPGTALGVLGRNGSGKSTLLATLLGLLPPVAGRVRCEAVRLAWVPQKSPLAPDLPLRAADVVAMGFGHRTTWDRWRHRTAVRSAIEQVLGKLGISGVMETSFHALSEGQRQRVLLAQAMVVPPALIVLDEPTAAMDGLAEQGVFDELDALRSEHGTAVVLVSHRIASVLGRVDRVLWLDRDPPRTWQGVPGLLEAQPGVSEVLRFAPGSLPDPTAAWPGPGWSPG
ncbi:MAG: ATP-binding cassette domain-containing protein [Candidatus Sericytochromatia bacterium]|nr:ATP-binding cassette domain-containing protein [Candidatus Tanganyikabacteria bacterium]